MWAQALLESSPSSQPLLLNYSFERFSRDLHAALHHDGVSDLSGWTSHCIRRGSGTDVLYMAGLAEMLKHGDWDCVGSAAHYADLDEMQAREIAGRAIDLSDDEDDLARASPFFRP